MPRRLRHAGDEGDRCGQDQWARRCCHQHRERPDQIARDQPSDEGKHQRHGKENQRVAVGETHERRFRSLRRSHQAHDAGIGAFPGGRGHHQLKGFAGVQGTGQDRNAARFHPRDRLSRQCRLIDGRRGRRDDAIDRNDFARPHQKLVADDHIRYRHLLDAVTDAAMRLAGRAIDQRAQIMLGAGNGDLLKHVAAGIH